MQHSYNCLLSERSLYISEGQSSQDWGIFSFILGVILSNHSVTCDGKGIAVQTKQKIGLMKAKESLFEPLKPRLHRGHGTHTRLFGGTSMLLQFFLLFVSPPKMR